MGLSVKFDAWNHLFPKWPNFIRIPASLNQILRASPRSEDELGYMLFGAIDNLKLSFMYIWKRQFHIVSIKD